MVEYIINCSDASKADVVLLSANYDKTSSFGKGADKGPKAIISCLDRQIELYERITGTEPCRKYKIAHCDLGDLNKLSPEKMIRKVANKFEQHYTTGKFVVVLGGEHSVSNGPFRVLALNRPSDITVFQIDAHADMRNDDSDYAERPHGKYAHSCVMRRACESGLKTVQVGIRAYSKDEYDYMKDKKLKVFEWGIGKPPSIGSIIKAVDTSKVYLTIDVDGIDPSHMPATGTPVQGGLEWSYTLGLLHELFKAKNVIASDIVEVAPRQGDTLTEYGAAQLCYNIIAHKMTNQKHCRKRL
jgi:agmatinase